VIKHTCINCNVEVITEEGQAYKVCLCDAEYTHEDLNKDEEIIES